MGCLQVWPRFLHLSLLDKWGFFSLVSVSFLVFWPSWLRALIASGPLRCLCWDFKGLGSLVLTLPLVKPKPSSKVVDQNIEPRGGVLSGVWEQT